MKNLRFFIIFLLISSCSNFDQLVKLDDKIKTRKDFNGILSKEYLEQARYNKHYFDWVDSEYFAKKGLMAYKNKQVFPEAPENWNITQDKIDELLNARDRMEMVTIPDVMRLYPDYLAKTMVSYDCWVERQEEAWNLGEVARCKLRFFHFLQKLEAKIAESKKVIKEEVKPVVAEVYKEELPPVIKPEKIDEKFVVYFDHDTYKMNKEAERKILEVIEYLRKLNGKYQILIEGFADRSGKEIYNEALARRRAISTRKSLMKNGIPQKIIAETTSFGEIKPEVLTRDNDRHIENRRAVIHVRNADDESEFRPEFKDSYISKPREPDNILPLKLEFLKKYENSPDPMNVNDKSIKNEAVKSEADNLPQKNSPNTQDDHSKSIQNDINNEGNANKYAKDVSGNIDKSDEKVDDKKYILILTE